MRNRILFMALAVGFVACASTGSRSGSRGTGTITPELIAGITATTAYDLIEKLRRTWLVARGPRSMFMDTRPAYPMVQVDGIWAGELSFLKWINASEVAEISLLSPTESFQLYGAGSPGGIIQVTTWQGRPQLPTAAPE